MQKVTKVVLIVALSIIISGSMISTVYLSQTIRNSKCKFTNPVQKTDANCSFSLHYQLSHPRIVIVEPVFTTSAYLSFYSFYRKYANIPLNYSVKSDLNLLNTSIALGWGYSSQLYSFANSDIAKSAGLIIGNNTYIMTDIDIDQGKLFLKNGSSPYNIIILGFEEYVTNNEYIAFRNFVLSGGKLIILSGGNFLAEVKYSSKSNTIALVKGHGWYFDGKEAVRSVYSRWHANNSEWIGSDYAYFIYSQHYSVEGAIANTSNPFSILLRTIYGPHLFSEYSGHEENVMTNKSDDVIAYWVLNGIHDPNNKVAIYELHAGKGFVYHVGISAIDILIRSKQLQFLLLSLLGLYTADVFINYSNCHINIIAEVKGDKLLNIGWRGWLSNGSSTYPMNEFNSTRLEYSASDCRLELNRLILFFAADDEVGGYVRL